MAKQKGLTEEDLAKLSPSALKQIKEQMTAQPALPKDFFPVKQADDIKKTIRNIDTKIFTALKDLTRVINSNKKDISDLQRSVNKVNEKVDRSEQTFETAQEKIISEIKKINDSFGRRIDDLQIKISSQSKELSDKIEKVSVDSEKNSNNLLSSFFGGITGAVGMTFARVVLAPVISGLIVGSITNIIGQKISEGLRPVKRALGWTEENFPRIYSFFQKYNIHKGGALEPTTSASSLVTQLQGMIMPGAMLGSGASTAEAITPKTAPTGESTSSTAAASATADIGQIKPIASSGSLAQNQKEAYSAAVSSGLSDKAARILVANMSGESLANPGLRRWDRKHYSQGIVQWEDDRSRRIKQEFGKWPIEMTVAEQTKAAIWEMKTDPKYSKSWQALNNEQLTDQQRMSVVVGNYERPQYPERDTERRLRIMAGMNIEAKPGTHKVETATAMPSTNLEQKIGGTIKEQIEKYAPPKPAPEHYIEHEKGKTPEPVPSAAPPSQRGTARPDIKQPEQAKMGASTTIPSGDLVALGHLLQKQGLLISEHPAFGGVKGKHATNSAHYSGRAIDVNIGTGNVEANDPTMGKRFDELAAQLRSAGYKVIWRAPGHYNHLHAQVGGGHSSLYQAHPGESASGQMSAPSPMTAGTDTTSAAPSTPSYEDWVKALGPKSETSAAPSPMTAGTDTTSAAPSTPSYEDWVKALGPKSETSAINPQNVTPGFTPYSAPMAMPMMGGMMGGGIMGMLSGMIGPMIGNLLGGASLMPTIPIMPDLTPQPMEIAQATQTSGTTANQNISQPAPDKSSSVPANQMPFSARPEWLGEFADNLLGTSYSGRTKTKSFAAGLGKQ